jgi:hypothetical protein
MKKFLRNTCLMGVFISEKTRFKIKHIFSQQLQIFNQKPF